MSNSNLGIIIPQEICGIICGDAELTQHDLYVLSIVSRAFNTEAERILYYSVRLLYTDQIKSFCTTVSRHPHLAQGMRKLTLMMPGPRLDPDDFARIKQMLHLSANLRYLRVLSTEWRSAIDRDQDWELEGYAFKLTTFVTEYFNSRDLAKFWEAQPAIETLAISPYIHPPIQLELCPSLKSLCCSPRLVHSISPTFSGQLQRLRLAMTSKMTPWDPIFTSVRTRFGQTLKGLSLDFNCVSSDERYNMGAIVSSIALYLPHIEFLEIIVRKLTGVDTIYDIYPSHPPGYTQLKTLIVHSSNLYRSASLYEQIDLLPTNEGRMAAATMIMKGLPTLQRLVLAAENKSTPAPRISIGNITMESLPMLKRLILDAENKGPTAAMMIMDSLPMWKRLAAENVYEFNRTLDGTPALGNTQVSVVEAGLKVTSLDVFDTAEWLNVKL